MKNEIPAVCRLVMVLICLVYFSGQADAQTKRFNKTARLVQHQIFSGDTAAYNDDRLRSFQVWPNGNIALTTFQATDTVRFNLLLLQKEDFGEGWNFSQDGIAQEGKTVRLLVEGPMEEMGFNDANEPIVVGKTIPVYAFSFYRETKATEFRKRLLQLIRYCSLGEGMFRKRYD